MKSITQICWIIGTGTDVGKSVVTAGLLRSVHEQGVKVQAIKAVQTGCYDMPNGERIAPDLLVYAEACPDAEHAALSRLHAPASPHLAASFENRILSASELARQIRKQAAAAQLTLVEGAGGLLTPLNNLETLAEVAMELNAPVVLVTANLLGSINHTLLTLEALRNRGLRVEAIVATTLSPVGASPMENWIHEDTLGVIRRRSGVDCIIPLPYYDGLSNTVDVDKRISVWEDLSQRLRKVAEKITGMHPEMAKEDAIVNFDVHHLWHPYASTITPEPLWRAEQTRGTRIWLGDGRELVDGMSSWWAAIHGYNHPELLAALREQAAEMPHVMFGGLTHASAVKLGRNLLALAPPGLERIFFADSGSVAVEVALKLAVQFQHASNRPDKCRIASLLGGYHGDTLGAMSVCDPVSGMHQLFSSILPRQFFLPRPLSRFDGKFDTNLLEPAHRLFAKHGSEIAALIVEPIVQGAGGMWFYHPEYLRGLHRLCHEHGVLLIADEIATGFGRTGKMFACEWADIVPDIMCVAKALTGGVMTLSAVLVAEHIAEAISHKGVLMHGPTFMANPLACAVAARSLEILAASPWQKQIANMERLLGKGLASCRFLPGVADVRVLGGIGVVEMKTNVNVNTLQKLFVNEAGVWIRPFARLIYVMPPYISSEEDLLLLTDAIVKAVEEGKWK